MRILLELRLLLVQLWFPPIKRYPLRPAETNALTRSPSFLVICLVPSCTDVEMSTHVRCFHKINICNDVKSALVSVRLGFIFILYATVRLQTSGPPFKGLVVQSRRSTAVFDGSSSFVGSFASGGADWKQWNCESVSELIVYEGNYKSASLILFYM